MFLPYDHLLEHGTVVRDHAAHVTANRVVLTSGAARLTPDLIVLATGSTYPFPAKSDQPNTVDAIGHYRAAHANLTRAHRVMLLGAGPVGLELAGEIRTAFPDVRVTIIDQAADILDGPYDPALRTELHTQLDELGVELMLGRRLIALPPTEPGRYGAFTVQAVGGDRVSADVWFRAFGVTPVSDYLDDALAAALTPRGSSRRRPSSGWPATSASSSSATCRRPIARWRASRASRPRWWRRTSSPTTPAASSPPTSAPLPASRCRSVPMAAPADRKSVV